MGSLRIPERYRAGVAAVGNLTDASFSDLLQALKDNASGDSAEELASRVHEHVGSLSVSVIAAILTAFSSMQGVQKTAHVDTAKFADDIWEALNSSSPELIEGAEVETLKERVNLLLDGTTIHLTSAKLTELRSDVERSFCSAKVITDVRTTTAGDDRLRPAMTVMQTLQLAFHDDLARHREFYVLVDENDLLVLRDAAEAAIQHRQQLTAALLKAEFEIFE